MTIANTKPTQTSLDDLVSRRIGELELQVLRLTALLDGARVEREKLIERITTLSADQQAPKLPLNGADNGGAHDGVA